MKRLGICIIFVISWFGLMAQSADQIIQSNLFDPARGQLDTAQDDENAPVEEVLPSDIPVLDGIVVIGDYRRAIFRYKDETTKRMESSVFKKGDEFGGARLLDLTEREAQIVFMGNRYNLTVDSKHEMKNVPRTSGAVPAQMAQQPSKPADTVVERKPEPANRAAARPVNRKIASPKRRPVNPKANTGASKRTPFGWTKGKKSTGKDASHNRKKDTPF